MCKTPPRPTAKHWGKGGGPRTGLFRVWGLVLGFWPVELPDVTIGGSSCTQCRLCVLAYCGAIERTEPVLFCYMRLRTHRS